MPDNTGSNWYVNAYNSGNVGSPNAPAYGGGGASDILTARDPLDAKRMAAGFAPGASYPDGYLGSMGGDRQQDRDLAVLQTRLTSTSYQRGIHAGEVIPKGAYYWSADMNPEMGLMRQAKSIPVDQEGGLVYSSPRYAPTGDPVEMLAHDGMSAGKTAREIESDLNSTGGDYAKNPVTVVAPDRAARMAQTGMLPRWSGVGSGSI